MKERTVLVVEDEPALRELYSTKLKMDGFKVEIALDGVEAIDKAMHVLPDIILLDVLLPKKDGFKVLKELKEQDKTKNIPVIILSSLGQDYEVKKGRTEGAYAYLIKTEVTPTEIVSKIKEIIS